MKRNYRLFLQDMHDAISDIQRYVGNMSLEDFSEDDKTSSAVVWKLENIGEASKQIPKEIRSKYKDVPWSDMAKLRDKIAHFYFGVKYRIVWEVVHKRLPFIKSQIETILAEIE